jgi:hypothetical protein
MILVANTASARSEKMHTGRKQKEKSTNGAENSRSL